MIPNYWFQDTQFINPPLAAFYIYLWGHHRANFTDIPQHGERSRAPNEGSQRFHNHGGGPYTLHYAKQA